jgi:hypothetical protein
MVSFIFISHKLKKQYVKEPGLWYVFQIFEINFTESVIVYLISMS